MLDEIDGTGTAIAFVLLAVVPAAAVALFGWGVLSLSWDLEDWLVLNVLVGFALDLGATFIGACSLGRWWLAVPGAGLSLAVSALVLEVVMTGWQPWSWLLGPVLLVLLPTCLIGASTADVVGVGGYGCDGVELDADLGDGDSEA
ncbi:MAG: hypothetical protein L0I24_26055 [Pseudonocardia sp.]|nr:hypothetical protein [Pseudonocardia sp.]